ncbi:MAG: von Willebrand factor type A domain-containing protein [Phycisphaeraceae bacterium]
MEHDLPALKRTAYALGELESAERAALEAELAQSPAARKEVAEVRQLAGVVASALASERIPGISEIQHLALESRIEQLSEEASEAARARVARQRMLFWIPTAIAACALLASSITLFMLSLKAQNTENPVVINSDPNAAKVEPARPRTSDIVKKYNEHLLAHPPLGTVAYFSPQVDTIVTPDKKNAEFHAFHNASITPLSSFPLTFDPKTYAFVQQFLERGTLPPKDAVYVEAMVNSYDYNVSTDQKQTEAILVRTEISDCPWRPGHRLARVTLKAKDAVTGEEVPVVADDVRVRVEFNPGRVSSYRLIGYENRWLMDGANPAEDRQPVKAGYRLTVLYEIVPTGVNARFEDAPGARLKYQRPAQLTHAANTDELFTVTLMYRSADDPLTKIVDVAAIDQNLRLADATGDFKFAAAVAQFGLLLMDSPAKGDAGYSSVRALAEQALGDDPRGQRADFLRIVAQAEKIVLN